MSLNLALYGNAKDGFFASGESDDEYLEPCPFCGSDSIVVLNTHTPSYRGECLDCGAQGPSNSYPRRPARARNSVVRQHKRAYTEAVDLWNRRTR